jgi:hypothetical protein
VATFFQVYGTTSLMIENVTLRSIANVDVVSVRCDGPLVIDSLLVTNRSYVNFMATSNSAGEFDANAMHVSNGSYVSMLMARRNDGLPRVMGVDDPLRTSNTSLRVRGARVDDEGVLELLATLVNITSVRVYAYVPPLTACVCVLICHCAQSSVDGTLIVSSVRALVSGNRLYAPATLIQNRRITGPPVRHAGVMFLK